MNQHHLAQVATNRMAQNQPYQQTLPPPLGAQCGTTLLLPFAAPMPNPSPASLAADVAAVEQVVDCMGQSGADQFKDVSLNELLLVINPNMHDDLRSTAPDVLMGLANLQDFNSPLPQQQPVQAPARPVVNSHPPRHTPTVVPRKQFVAHPQPPLRQQQSAPVPPPVTATAPQIPQVPSGVSMVPNNQYMAANTAIAPMFNPSMGYSSAPTNLSYAHLASKPAAVATYPQNPAAMYAQNMQPHAVGFVNQYSAPMYNNPTHVLASSAMPTPVCGNSSVPKPTSSDVGSKRIRRTKGQRVSWNDPAVLQAIAAAEAMLKQESTIAAVAPANAAPNAPAPTMVVPNQIPPGMVTAVPVSAAPPTMTHVMPQVSAPLVSSAPQMMAQKMVVQQQLGVQPQKVAPNMGTILTMGPSATPLFPEMGVPPPTTAGGAAELLAQEEEERKIARAERNRHSAAASRERKKQYLNELERRVAVLSKRNAQLQIKQIRAVGRRVQRERELQAENEKLKIQKFEMDMEISKLHDNLEQMGIGLSKYSVERRKLIGNVRRPNTYDNGVAEWEAAARWAVEQEIKEEQEREEEKRRRDAME